MYGVAPNESLLQCMGGLQGTVLDVGPGEGEWATLLRRAGATTLAAIEPDSRVRSRLESRYDIVVSAELSRSTLAMVPRPDVIIAADVFEHMLDPWDAMKMLREAVRPEARLYVSVPNLRFIGLLFPALVRGVFNYTDAPGLRDRGHIRWFTSRSLIQDLREAGWEVDHTGGPMPPRFSRWDRMTFGRFRDMLRHQISISAVAR